jgi:hypothetical protein
MDNRWKHKWAAPSSSSNDYYIVAEPEDPTETNSSKDEFGRGPSLACGCLGWTRHMPRTDCKHIREVRFLIMGRHANAKTLEQAIVDRMLGRPIGNIK